MTKIYKNLPKKSGVYLMKNKSGEIIYIGKAANLQKRVKSYFIGKRDQKIKKLANQVKTIDYKKTDSTLSALILEAKLIKKYKPKFNVKEKDDRSFLYVEITNEKFPRVLLTRGKEKRQREKDQSHWYGPFTKSSGIREALKILRKIFPYNTHPPKKIEKFKRPCTYYQIGLCPGTCVGNISEKDYKQTIKNLEKIFQGKTKNLIKSLKKQMKQASQDLKFEKAKRLKKQIFGLKHIQDTSLIKPSSLKSNSKIRIEGYDISNISGKFGTGSMIVFKNGSLKKEDYRKFKIRTIQKQNDIGMIKEVINRRLKHKEWSLPDLILIDGGKAQVKAVKDVLEEQAIKIPVTGIAKGPKRNKNIFVNKPKNIKKQTLIRIRDEAHRFAINYHKKLRQKNYKL